MTTYVLGVSGLPASQSYLRDRVPDLHALDERICQGLDSAACLLADGRVVAAAAEERFSGEKGTGDLPLEAIGYCLRTAGIEPAQVDAIAHGFDYDSRRRAFAHADGYFDRVLAGATVIDGLTAAGWADVASRFHPVDHHLAHAASAYWPSGFERALCIVSDGMGEIVSLTVYRAAGGRLERLHAHSIPNSLGILYSICTRFLGFAFNSDEYKVMGLAAYGDPSRDRALFRRLVEFSERSGTIRVRWPRGTLADPEQGYPRAMAWLAHEAFAPEPLTDVLDQRRADFAAALQERFTEVLVELTEWWLRRTGERNLCLSGGSFLNCKANESLCDLPSVDDVFVQPASADDGTALGAALHVSAALGRPYAAPGAAFDPYLGPAYVQDEIRAAIERVAEPAGLQWRHVGLTDEYFAAAADDIAADRVLAWFHGRMEFGPRALGNRSIVALPGGAQIKDRINGLVKFREPFRPFAPAVMEEDRDAVFETRGLDPVRYMLCTAPVRDERREAVSGVVHEDGSARLQSVSRDFNETFWTLLRHVRDRTGIGCVINTSLNVKGQPLIMDPETAIRILLESGIDRLYIEGTVVSRT
jgi:carbamoyltransferase